MSNNINDPQKSLAECQTQFLHKIENLDAAPPFCGRDDELNKRGVNSPDLNWLEEDNTKKEGLGARADCDPMRRGLIRNDPADLNPTTLYRNTNGLRGCDEAILDMFSNIEVLDEDGKAHRVPIIWASQEKAVAAIMQDNVRKDETLVVDRIRLPMLAVNSTDFQYDANRYTYHGALDFMRGRDGKPGFAIKEKYDRDTVFGRARGIPINITYTLYAWTLYIQDMNQIIEQILSKFSLDAYIRVRGVAWEVPVELDSIANNLDVEPGDQAVRVVKFQFNFTAKTYIPQPITRRKAVLKTRVELVDGVTDEEITQVIGRLEEAVKELEC
jgi:hypothetical protein